MASVTQRIKEIKQPYGGYVKPRLFETTELGATDPLNEKENIHASIIGLAVDYMTRFCMGKSAEDAFRISLLGAEYAYQLVPLAKESSSNYIKSIKGLDDQSIISACNLVQYDIFYRNTAAAMATGYRCITPDNATIQNIRIMVQRSLHFFDIYGKITCDGFDFTPENENLTDLMDFIFGGKQYGGYTTAVHSGDGDFLTEDTLWDFKVSKGKPTSKHTLQLLMYWIMGQHSGKKIFEDITKIGIYNPRLDTVYRLDISQIPEDTIRTVERDVIGYKDVICYKIG